MVDPKKVVIKHHSGKHNLERFGKYFIDNKDGFCNNIMQEIDNGDVENASRIMENLLGDAHHDAKENIPKSDIQITNFETKMEKANDEFSEHQRCLLGLSQDDIGTVIERHQKARNEISKEMCAFEHNEWNIIVTDSNR